MTAPLTDAERRRIVDRYNVGESAEEIARAERLPLPAVQWAIRRAEELAAEIADDNAYRTWL